MVDAWRREGLELKDVYGSVAGGRVGNSLDAQRLILLARAQGREDACIEAIYAANHEQGRCLGGRAALLDCASAAGVGDLFARGWQLASACMCTQWDRVRLPAAVRR